MERGERLLNVMRRVHVTTSEIASNLNMNRSTFYRKIKDPRASFTMEQVFKIKNLLSMSKDDFQAIFF